MIKVVIATHGTLAKGLKESIEFIMGKQNELTAISAYTSECVDFEQCILDFIKKNNNDEIIFVTDLLGGSVNNELLKICDQNKNLHLVSGANMPLLIQILINIKNDNVQNLIEEGVSQGKKGIQNCKIKMFSGVEKQFDQF